LVNPVTAAPDNVVLEVAGLHRSFGRLRALDDVSLQIRGGAVVGLIGPNGAGKTTLLECAAGLLSCDAGEVRVAGRPRTGESSADLFYLPDAIAPWPAEPVRWALDFGAGFFGASVDRRADLVERLDLADLLHRPMGALSKGQRKRALLAVALLMPHPILLIDEPFEGLDLRQGREVATVLRAEAASGRTLFLSIHQMADAARVCDRFVLLSGGRVKGAGTLDELAAAAAARGATGVHNLEEVFLALT
jgi:ABC-2 type transport system ATP-binding protein